MLSALLVSQIISWTVIIGLVITCLALLRQVGVLHERMMPFGAMMSDGGPDVGDAAPVMEAREVGGTTIKIGEPSAMGASTLLMFVSATCPVCKRLLPVVRRFVHEEKLALILVGDGDSGAYKSLLEQQEMSDVPLVNSPGVGMRYQVGKLPYAVLLDEAGVIRGKGLVNTREHLESLVVAKDMKLQSMDKYLEKQRNSAAEQSRPQPDDVNASNAALEEQN